MRKGFGLLAQFLSAQNPSACSHCEQRFWRWLLTPPILVGASLGKAFYKSFRINKRFLNLRRRFFWVIFAWFLGPRFLAVDVFLTYLAAAPVIIRIGAC